MKNSLITTLFLALSLGSSQAEGLFSSVTKGDVIFDEPLPASDAKKKFAHGTMEVLEGGGIKGRTKPEADGHAANYALKFEHEDAIYTFEFKLEGDVYGGIRVGYHMASRTLEADRITISKSAEAPVTLEKGKWHTATVTRIGKQVQLQVGDVTIVGEEPKLTPTIDAIRLSVKGSSEGSVSYRKLKIWKAVKE
ncbi:MAG: hypothetical protein AAGH89_11725 [Verrucomicrobiota bacterium]